MDLLTVVVCICRGTLHHRELRVAILKLVATPPLGGSLSFLVGHIQYIKATLPLGAPVGPSNFLSVGILGRSDEKGGRDAQETSIQVFLAYFRHPYPMPNPKRLTVQSNQSNQQHEDFGPSKTTAPEFCSTVASSI